MCLHPISGAEIAEEDIPIYKFLFVEKDNYHPFKSIVQLANCQLNTIYSAKICFKYESIEEGLHAYVSMDACNRQTGWCYDVIASGIIPAGSMYYIGSDGDIVSNTMIYHKVIGYNSIYLSNGQASTRPASTRPRPIHWINSEDIEMDSFITSLTNQLSRYIPRPFISLIKSFKRK